MNRGWLTGRSGQGLALGLTLAGLAVLWFGAVAPLIEWHGERAEALTQREALAQHMLTLQAALPPLRQRAAAMAAGRAAEGGLLDGESDPAASAFMQERLQGMFMQAGVQLNSVETVAGRRRGRLSPYSPAGFVQCKLASSHGTVERNSTSLSSVGGERVTG
jgi:general secretion pathway protein M